MKNQKAICLHGATFEALQVENSKTGIEDAIKFAREDTPVMNHDITIASQNGGILIWDCDIHQTRIARFGDYIIRETWPEMNRMQYKTLTETEFNQLFKFEE